MAMSRARARASLETLIALVAIKFNSLQSCYEVIITKEKLKCYCYEKKL